MKHILALLAVFLALPLCAQVHLPNGQTVNFDTTSVQVQSFGVGNRATVIFTPGIHYCADSVCSKKAVEWFPNVAKRVSVNDTTALRFLRVKAAKDTSIALPGRVYQDTGK